jgi:hypothetical protein
LRPGATVLRAPQRAREASPQATRSTSTAWTIALLSFIGAGIALGIAMRVWYVLHDPVDADQALVGILARQILAGHFHAFLLGQPYGGVEPYLVAAVFGVAGSSPMTLAVPVLLCDAVSCVLVWRTALRLSGRADIAAVCAVGMWAAPQSAVWNSTLEYGFRGVTLVCGTGMLLVALRIHQGSGRWWGAPLLGALAGVGWWSSPEIAYFAVPCAIWLGSWLWRSRHARGALLRDDALGAAAGVVMAGAGALPWLWDNVTSGFPSLSLSKYNSPGAIPPFTARLGIFFHDTLPLVLDLRVPRSGAWDMAAPLAIAVVVVLSIATVAAVLWHVARRTDAAAVALGVIAYPLLLSAVPASVVWRTGRYTNFLVPLLALLVAGTVGEVRSRRTEPVASAVRDGPRPRPAILLVASLVGLLLTSVVSFGDLRVINVLPGAQLGPTAEQPAEALDAALQRAGIRGGYADYWVAYKLDYLSSGGLEIGDTPPSPDRLPAVQASVHALPARQQAWIFVSPTPTGRTEYADTAVIRGPSGMPVDVFLSRLDQLGVVYRVLHDDGAEAVVCAHRVSPADIGLRVDSSQ